MAERTAIESLTGATVAISASLPATYDAAGYGATTITYTAVGKVESIGEFGPTWGTNGFTPVDTGVTEKVKTTVDYGSLPLVLASLPSDAGQDVCEAATASRNRYSVKLTMPDTGVWYLDVLVTKFTQVNGAAGDVRKVNCQFDVCRSPVYVAQV